MFLSFLPFSLSFVIYLASPGLSCGMQDLLSSLLLMESSVANSWLWHVGSSSLPREQTWSPLYWERGVVATGPPGKFYLLALTEG